MWDMVAKEMNMPARAIEAMHWQMGEREMAERANTHPFQLASTSSSSLRSPPTPTITPVSAYVANTHNEPELPAPGRFRRSISDSPGRRRTVSAGASSSLAPSQWLEHEGSRIERADVAIATEAAAMREIGRYGEPSRSQETAHRRWSGSAHEMETQEEEEEETKSEERE